MNGKYAYSCACLRIYETGENDKRENVVVCR